MFRLFGVTAILVMAGCMASQSYANVFDTYGLGASSIALGNATTAGGPTDFAAYSNPALLVQADRNEISSNALLTRFHLQDLPADQAGRLPRNPNEESQAQDILGGSLGLNLKLTDDLHFGLAAYLPQGSVGRIKGISPYESTYLRYAEQQQKPAAYTALAIKGPWGFAVGLGAYYSIKARGILQVALDSKESEGRLDFVMEPVVVPYAGISWNAGQWTVGALYREAQKTESSIDSSFGFSTESGMIPFEASTSLIPFYDPQLVRLGLAWHGERLQLMASLEQASWAQFKAPIVNITGADVAALSVENRSGNAGLSDTRALRMGLEMPVALTQDRLLLRAGLEDNTSANQKTKPSYVVDPGRQTAALGAAFTFEPDKQGRQLCFEGAFQYSQLSSLQSRTPKDQVIDLNGRSSIQTWVGGMHYVL